MKLEQRENGKLPQTVGTNSELSSEKGKINWREEEEGEGEGREERESGMPILMHSKKRRRKRSSKGWQHPFPLSPSFLSVVDKAQ